MALGMRSGRVERGGGGLRFRGALVMAAGLWLGVWAGGCRESPAENLQSNSRQERSRALGELAKKNHDDAVKHVEAAARHEDVETAREACRALGRMRHRTAAQALRRVVGRDGRAVVRKEAAVYLGRKRGPESADALAAAVTSDEDPGVRAAAAASLGMIGRDGDVPLLVRVAEEDPDLRVQSSAVKAVERMVSLRFGYDSKAPEAERRAAVWRMRYWATRTLALRRAMETEKGDAP